MSALEEMPSLLFTDDTALGEFTVAVWVDCWAVAVDGEACVVDLLGDADDIVDLSGCVLAAELAVDDA